MGKLYWSIFFSAFLIYVLAACVVLWLMFEKIYMCVVAPVCGSPLFIVLFKRYMEKKKQQYIENEFYKLMNRISMSMASGMILENALKETITVDKKDYKVLGQCLEKMYRMIQNNYSVESTFKILAQDSNNREIKIFYEVLTVGSPMGINMTELIRYLSSEYRLRADTESEITRILNAPKYNNRIILIMPFVCIALFKQVAPDYMAALYTSTGRIVMVIVAVMLVFAWWLGEKIGKISY